MPYQDRQLDEDGAPAALAPKADAPLRLLRGRTMLVVATFAVLATLFGVALAVLHAR